MKFWQELQIEYPQNRGLSPSKIFDIPTPLSVFASHLVRKDFICKQGKIWDRTMLGRYTLWYFHQKSRNAMFAQVFRQPRSSSSLYIGCYRPLVVASHLSFEPKTAVSCCKLVIHIVMQFSGTHQTVVRQSLDSWQAVVRQLSGSCQVVIRQHVSNQNCAAL